MDTSFTFEIFSPGGVIFSETVKEISVPTDKGEITILPNHISLFTKLGEGEVKIVTSRGEKIVAIVGGFLEVKDNKITLLSDYAVQAENLQIAVAEAKAKRTKEALAQQESGVNFSLLEKELQRSLLELKVASKMKGRSRLQG